MHDSLGSMNECEACTDKNPLMEIFQSQLFNLRDEQATVFFLLKTLFVT